MGTLERLQELEGHCVAHDEPTNPAAAWVLRYDKLELLVQSECVGWRYANELEQERKRLQSENAELREILARGTAPLKAPNVLHKRDGTACRDGSA